MRQLTLDAWTNSGGWEPVTTRLMIGIVVHKALIFNSRLSVQAVYIRKGVLDEMVEVLEACLFQREKYINTYRGVSKNLVVG